MGGPGRRSTVRMLFKPYARPLAVILHLLPNQPNWLPYRLYYHTVRHRHHQHLVQLNCMDRFIGFFAVYSRAAAAGIQYLRDISNTRMTARGIPAVNNQRGKEVMR